jgi:hypothetical protein
MELCASITTSTPAILRQTGAVLQGAAPVFSMVPLDNDHSRGIPTRVTEAPGRRKPPLNTGEPLNEQKIAALVASLAERLETELITKEEMDGSTVFCLPENPSELLRGAVTAAHDNGALMEDAWRMQRLARIFHGVAVEPEHTDGYGYGPPNKPELDAWYLGLADRERYCEEADRQREYMPCPSIVRLSLGWGIEMERMHNLVYDYLRAEAIKQLDGEKAETRVKSVTESTKAPPTSGGDITAMTARVLKGRIFRGR